MDDLGRRGERTAALFLFGLLAFNPPLLSIFDRSVFVFGVPLLYFYLFCVWGLTIALIAVNTGMTAGPRQGPHRESAEILLPGGREGP